MRVLTGVLLACGLVVVTSAQTADPPLNDTRLTVHTLLREDIFAGFLDNNMTRFERGEKNLASLLESRPEQKAELLAWRAGAEMYRAVLANDAGKQAEFDKQFAAAQQDFAEAAKLSGANGGVLAIAGGVNVVFADRLPERYRAAAWQQAYDGYAILWKAQQAQIEQMPPHFKGELLAGMAQAAQRTGRADESAQFVDKMLTMLVGTSYEKDAKEWKANPASAATSNLTCKTCHGAGRLQARLHALNK